MLRKQNVFLLNKRLSLLPTLRWTYMVREQVFRQGVRRAGPLHQDDDNDCEFSAVLDEQ